ncbi:MAG: hypothetical protein KAR19_00385 [Bacteroidales bacterium]|nr:hypothetical protein [Bacteroidales bacterium]
MVTKNPFGVTYSPLTDLLNLKDLLHKEDYESEDMEHYILLPIAAIQ